MIPMVEAGVMRRISLRPIRASERDLFFTRATDSDGTPWWYGDQWGEPIPDRETFFGDWKDFYFDDGDDRGQAHWILLGEEIIGQINYQAAEKGPGLELDIIIFDAEYLGQGHGTTALGILVGDLEHAHPGRSIEIHVSPDNPRARRSYEKSGFELESSYVEDGIEWLRLVRYRT